MEPLKRLGFKISEIRKTKGLTQEELAERAALTLSYISKIETGRRNPTTTTLYKISLGLDVEIHQLFVNLEPELMSNESIFKRIRKLINILEDREGI